MRKNHLFALGLAVMLAVVAVTTAGGQASAQETDYVVLYAEGASLASARQAVKAAGGAIVSENTDVGVATVRTTNPNFLSAVAGAVGAGRRRPQPADRLRDAARRGRAGTTVEKLTAAERGGQHAAPRPSTAGKPKKPPSRRSPATAEPLAGLQWDMAMIHATAGGSYKKDPGDPGVLVGIIDTGIDGTHPDIAPNFDAALSRNFVTDIPTIDGAVRASRAASIRSTRTTTATARTSPARSAPR